MKILGILLSLLLILSCSSREKLRDRSPELSLLQSGQALAKSEKFPEALATFGEFQETYEHSVFIAQVYLEVGLIYYKTGKFAEAVEELKKAQEAAQQSSNQILAESTYYMGLSYEGLGDDVRATALLLDAEKRRDYLEPGLGRAELPAKLASIYVRHGHTQVALSYLVKAEKGLEAIKALDKKYSSQDFVSELYYKMGSVIPGQVDEKTINDRIRSVKLVQVYLFKAMRLDKAPWAQKAKESLLESYRDFMQTFNLQENLNAKLETGAELMALFDQAELFKVSSDIAPTAMEKEVFAYLSSMKNKVSEFVYKPRTYVEETVESQKLNSLKKEGQLKVDTLLPEEEEAAVPLPPKVISEEDPNL